MGMLARELSNLDVVPRCCQRSSLREHFGVLGLFLSRSLRLALRSAHDDGDKDKYMK